jgi:hypothetical protein
MKKKKREKLSINCCSSQRPWPSSGEGFPHPAPSTVPGPPFLPKAKSVDFANSVWSQAGDHFLCLLAGVQEDSMEGPHELCTSKCQVKGQAVASHESLFQNLAWDLCLVCPVFSPLDSYNSFHFKNYIIELAFPRNLSETQIHLPPSYKLVLFSLISLLEPGMKSTSRSRCRKLPWCLQKTLYDVKCTGLVLSPVVGGCSWWIADLTYKSAQRQIQCQALPA